jgi:hypothetical protein
MNSPDWDDDEPIFIDDEDFEGDSLSLDELKKEIFQDKVIHGFVQEAFQFNGREAINEILSEIERKMGWKLEIIATRGSIEDAVLERTNTFDEDAWIRFLMSDVYDRMSYRVIYESELAVDEFMDDSYESLSLGARARRYIKKTVWNLFQNI